MNCLKLDILCIGKLKDRAFENRCQEYLKWLSPYAKIRLTELPDSDKARENAALLRHLEKAEGSIIVLSEDGQTFTSRGFAAGPAFLFAAGRDVNVPEYVVGDGEVLSELARFHAARAETRRQLEKLVAEFGGDGGAAESRIFSNHLVMLDDVTIVSAVEKLVREEHLNAACALRRTMDGFREVFGRMDDPYLRERVRDVDDVETRLLLALLGKTDPGFPKLSSPVVVVAEDLTPSETVSLPREFILGFATDRGSTTSHVALLARALGIPAVTGLGDVSSRVHAGDQVLLDGTNGTVTLNPDSATRAAFDHLVHREKELLAMLAEDGGAGGAMKDGTPVKLCANVQPGVPLAGLSTFGVQGIGLYRSEYLWLGRADDPSEEEQFAAYSDAVRAAARLGGDARVVFRVLDLGGDKLQHGVRSHESNPFLGCRSIRWLLSHRAVLRTQLRAILRASALGKASVMFPLVSDIGELHEANGELSAAMDALKAEGVEFDAALPRGCMIEVPSAALCADAFAREVDFFSIGTNDLVQYTMAADRGNALVNYLYQPTNPAVLKLVDMTIRAADGAGIPVCVCGESASDPVLGVLWVGLGAKMLSMSPSYVPLIRKVLRSLTIAEARDIASEAVAMGASSSAAEIYARVRERLVEKMPRLEELRAFFA